MKLGELQEHHLVLQLQHATCDSIQHVAQDAPLLRVHYLVVALLESAEDLNVFDVQGGDVLECGESVLFWFGRFDGKFCAEQVCEAVLSLSPLLLVVAIKGRIVKINRRYFLNLIEIIKIINISLYNSPNGVCIIKLSLSHNILHDLIEDIWMTIIQNKMNYNVINNFSAITNKFHA